MPKQRRAVTSVEFGTFAGVDAPNRRNACHARPREERCEFYEEQGSSGDPTIRARLTEEFFRALVERHAALCRLMNTGAVEFATFSVPSPGRKCATTRHEQGCRSNAIRDSEETVNHRWDGSGMQAGAGRRENAIPPDEMERSAQLLVGDARARLYCKTRRLKVAMPARIGMAGGARCVVVRLKNNIAGETGWRLPRPSFQV